VGVLSCARLGAELCDKLACRAMIAPACYRSAQVCEHADADMHVLRVRVGLYRTQWGTRSQDHVPWTANFPGRWLVRKNSAGEARWIVPLEWFV
jgi:hypothetical protein